MAWIESNQELARHPKAKKAARMLGISVPAVVGHLHFLWWWCLEYAYSAVVGRARGSFCLSKGHLLSAGAFYFG